MSSKGSKQGCPLGGILYNLATQETLESLTEELPGGGVFGFADDTNLVGTNSDCVRAFVKFEEMVSELSGTSLSAVTP